MFETQARRPTRTGMTLARQGHEIIESLPRSGIARSSQGRGESSKRAAAQHLAAGGNWRRCRARLRHLYCRGLGQRTAARFAGRADRVVVGRLASPWSSGLLQRNCPLNKSFHRPPAWRVRHRPRSSAPVLAQSVPQVASLADFVRFVAAICGWATAACNPGVAQKCVRSPTVSTHAEDPVALRRPLDSACGAGRQAGQPS